VVGHLVRLIEISPVDNDRKANGTVQLHQRRRPKRRVNVQQDQPSLFDLLLEESGPWEPLEAEQQLQAIDILARLIANATMDHEEENDDE
jgi:hypothetical protein